MTSRRAVRWLLPAAALALAPKCLLCVFAYTGLAATLGLAGPELCGAATASSPAWITTLALLGLTCGGISTVGHVCFRRSHVQSSPFKT